MALLHHAEITPSKIEILAAWVPTQPWFSGNTGAGFTNVAAFRLDDPNGEVGIETVLVQAGDGPVLQVPLTYRDAPLVGAEASLIGTTQHSVLGERWVYDAVGDPVYLATTAAVALTGGVQAEQYFEEDGERIVREPTARVVGDGIHGTATPALPPVSAITTAQVDDTTVADAGEFQIVVLRQLSAQSDDASVPTPADPAGPAETGPTAVLSGAWPSNPVPQPLVLVQLSAV
jgi:hypothetical protein